MEVLRALVSSPLPAHLLLYSSLLGSTLYQSWIMTKLCYLHLPMPQFTSLQKRVFPVYFRIEFGLALAVLATYPQRSFISLIQNAGNGKWGDALILGVNMLTATTNLLVYGPRTKDLMVERIHQETKDGRRFNDESKSEEMKLVNRKFSRAHAMAIHLNAIGMAAMVCFASVTDGVNSSDLLLNLGYGVKGRQQFGQTSQRGRKP